MKGSDALQADLDAIRAGLKVIDWADSNADVLRGLWMIAVAAFSAICRFERMR